MNKIFYKYKSLESLPEIKCWNFDKVNNMDDILEGSPYIFPLIKSQEKWEKIKKMLYSYLISVKGFILSTNINYAPFIIMMILFSL